MLAPTVLQVWRSERCGSLCVVLLLVGWLVSGSRRGLLASRPLCVYGTAASTLRRARHRIFAQQPWLIGVLVLARDHRYRLDGSLVCPGDTRDRESRALAIARTILGLDCLPVVLAFLLGSWALCSRSIALRRSHGTRARARQRRLLRPARSRTRSPRVHPLRLKSSPIGVTRYRPATMCLSCRGTTPQDLPG